MYAVTYLNKLNNRINLKHFPWSAEKDKVITFKTIEDAQKGVEWLKVMLPTKYHSTIMIVDF